MKAILNISRRPDISFYRNGRILISARVVKLLSINPGDSINIILNDDEVLLSVVRHFNNIGRFVAQCYPSKKNSRNFCANSAKLSQFIFNFIKGDIHKASFYVGSPVSLYGNLCLPIIINNPK